MEAKRRQGFALTLGRARGADERAQSERIALVDNELRRLASRWMRGERPDPTLLPSALVLEAVIRLLGEAINDRAADRSFLFASAARAMREVLVDHPRWLVPLNVVVDDFEGQGLDVVAVHEALDRPAELDGRQAQLMPRRYFGGMTVSEVPEAVGITVVAMERDWRLARGWPDGQLGGGDG